MSKTAIIKSGENYFMKQLSLNKAIVLDQVIFANISGVNGNTDIDLNGTMPTASQIVHKTAVTQSGLLNDRTVVYSVILDTNVGDFAFNYIGLVNSETNILCLVMHTDATKKIKTAGQQQGNTITESLWLEMDNASTSTGITVNADTWQIDYSQRMAGEDERIRLSNFDMYGRLAINDGMKITKSGTQCTVAAGLAYVAGLRINLEAAKAVTVANNQSLYIDAWLAGTTTGEWSVNYNLIAGTNLKDYTSGIFKHYVERIASVDASGNLTVVNAKSFVTTNDLASTTQTGIVKLNSSTNSTSETEAATLLAVKNVNDNANNAHNRITTVNNTVALITDKFQSDNLESRMCSPNHGFYLIMRNDGVVGMYNKAQGRLPWGFSDNGVLCEGYVPASRVTDLDQFVRDRSTPVGVPLPWPQVYPPSGYFECNGSQFNKAQFPKLASAYPSGYLPDLRGEFIRGWDNARGADPYRVILSWQTDAIRNIWGGIYGTNNMSHAFIGDSVSTAGAFRVNGVGKKQAIPNEGGQTWGCEEIIFDPSIASPIGSDNHPRNVAFMYIVKAE